MEVVGVFEKVKELHNMWMRLVKVKDFDDLNFVELLL
jgi:hypothetical protein